MRFSVSPSPSSCTFLCNSFACAANANHAASVTSITHLFTVAATQTEAAAVAEAETAAAHAGWQRVADNQRFWLLPVAVS